MHINLPFLLLISVTAASCSVLPGSLHSLHKKGLKTERDDLTLTLSENGGKEMQATYLGCGGLLLQRGKDAILIDPFFSNQKTGRIGRSVFLGKEGRKLIRPNEWMLKTGLDAVRRNLNDGKVHAIISAHSHYDHLMDIPAVYNYFRREPRLLLTASGRNIIHRTVDAEDVTVAENFASDHTTLKEPFEIPLDVGKIRIFPIQSAHNPHFRNIKFFSGEQTVPVDDLSDSHSRTKANLWLEGNTFSFVIDFVDDTGAIDFRAFVQSSSCNAPAGVPPPQLMTRPVDVAFIGVVSYHFSPGYPCELLSAIAPRQVVWIHWEDFFRRYDRKPKTVRGTNVPGFFDIPCVAGEKKNGKMLWPRVNLRLVY